MESAGTSRSVSVGAKILGVLFIVLVIMVCVLLAGYGFSSCVRRLDREIIGLTESEATVTVEAQLSNATYRSTNGVVTPNGSAYRVSFPGPVTNTVVFPENTRLGIGDRLRLKYVRSPFHESMFATDFGTQ